MFKICLRFIAKYIWQRPRVFYIMKHMGKIYVLMGKSSSGKDTIYRALLNKIDLSLKKIIPYTTRPIRENEKEGREYHFCDKAALNSLRQEGKVIECRTYNTVHGEWDYFTVDDGQVDLSKDDYLIIGTIEACRKLREYYGKEKIVPIYIEVEDGIRLERALIRERQQARPRYEEMCRRFIADSKDFSPEEIEKAEITAIFENDDVAETVEKVADYIRSSR